MTSVCYTEIKKLLHSVWCYSGHWRWQVSAIQRSRNSSTVSDVTLASEDDKCLLYRDPDTLLHSVWYYSGLWRWQVSAIQRSRNSCTVSDVTLALGDVTNTEIQTHSCLVSDVTLASEDEQCLPYRDPDILLFSIWCYSGLCRWQVSAIQRSRHTPAQLLPYSHTDIPNLLKYFWCSLCRFWQLWEKTSRRIQKWEAYWLDYIL